MKTKFWVATIPKKVDWATWLKEMDVVAAGTHSKYFKIPKHSSMFAGDVLYVVHDGAVRGHLPVTAVHTHSASFTCSTTGSTWPPGCYAELSAPFTPVKPRPMKGFQGVRRYAR